MCVCVCVCVISFVTLQSHDMATVWQPYRYMGYIGFIIHGKGQEYLVWGGSPLGVLVWQVLLVWWGGFHIPNYLFHPSPLLTLSFVLLFVFCLFALVGLKNYLIPQIFLLFPQPLY